MRPHVYTGSFELVPDDWENFASAEHYRLDKDDSDERETPKHRRGVYYPYSQGNEDMRLHKECYAHTASRLESGEAILVDCGAIDNLSGQDIIERQARIAERFGKKVEYTQLDRPIEVNGVGEGSQMARLQANLPVQIAGECARFRTPVLTGTGAQIPALRGLRSQRAVNALIDAGGRHVIIPGIGGFTVALSPGSKVIPTVDAISGHMMIPISDFVNRSSEAERWILYGTTGQQQVGKESDASSLSSSL